jgi:V8-like Glu-specific endopeptidase
MKLQKRIKLASTAATLALAAACGAPDDGLTLSDSKMIIGGDNFNTAVDTQDAFPYNGTAVQLTNGCSGGYVSGQFILSAAHCVVPPATTVGVRNRFSGTQNTRVWARGAYEASGRDHDWMLLVSNEPVGYSAGSGSLDFVAPAAGQGTTVVGYPGHLGGVLARSDGTIREDFNMIRYGHDTDITGGSSGSIMGRVDGGTFRVNGVQSWHFWPDARSQMSQSCSSYVTASCANEAVSIRQFRMKVAEVQSLESMRIVADFNGDGKKEILMRDASGVSIVDLNGGVREIARMFNGQRYGDWTIDANDQILMVRDFLREGRAEILVRSWWGLGLLQLGTDGQFRSVAMVPNGTRVGGWILASTDSIVGGGDFQTNGRDGIIIRSGWGMGLLTVDRGGFRNPMLVPHGTRFAGGWNFDVDDAILGVLPMTYGVDRLLIRSNFGTGVLYLDTTTLMPTTAALVTYGNRFPGGWLHSAQDVIVSVGGDMNGDGYSEFAIRSAWGFGVIDASLKGVALQGFGTRAGGWVLATDNQIVGFGPARGNGGYGLIVQSHWGIGMLAAHNGAFTSTAMVPYGTRLAGGWLLSRRDRISAIGNLDNSNGAVEEMLIRSPWGVGVVKLDQASSAMTSPVLFPYGTAVGRLALNADTMIPAR